MPTHSGPRSAMARCSRTPKGSRPEPAAGSPRCAGGVVGRWAPVAGTAASGGVGALWRPWEGSVTGGPLGGTLTQGLLVLLQEVTDHEYCRCAVMACSAAPSSETVVIMGTPTEVAAARIW